MPGFAAAVLRKLRTVEIEHPAVLVSLDLAR